METCFDFYFAQARLLFCSFLFLNGGCSFQVSRAGSSLHFCILGFSVIGCSNPFTNQFFACAFDFLQVCCFPSVFCRFFRMLLFAVSFQDFGKAWQVQIFCAVHKPASGSKNCGDFCQVREGPPEHCPAQNELVKAGGRTCLCERAWNICSFFNLCVR